MIPLKGSRVVVMGLGLHGGGVGVVRYLHACGARIRICDLRLEAELRPSLDALRGIPLELRLGPHDPRDFEACDLVVPNPAVPPSAPILERCRARGIAIHGEIDLLIDALPNKAIAVTGSNGKSSTSAMIAHLLARLERPHALGGNIGISLLERCSTIAPEAVLVLELSSYQLEYLNPSRPWPDIAVWTNLQPDHLARHGDLAGYAHAKEAITRFQDPDQWCVLNGADDYLRTHPPGGRGRRRWVAQAPRGMSPSFLLGARGELCARDARASRTLLSSEELGVRGSFQRINALQALAALLCLGIAPERAAPHLKSFQGLPHRLEDLGFFAGRHVIDNGVSTTPETTRSALESMGGRPLVLICGGQSKRLELAELADSARACCSRAHTFGASAGELARALRAAGVEVSAHGDLDQCLHHAHALSAPGDLILFSPACASFDAYPHFRARAEHFRALLAEIFRPQSSQPSQGP